MPVVSIQRSILDILCPYDHKQRRNIIIQFCDCNSIISYGSIRELFGRYPHADSYLKCITRKPGSIDIFEDCSKKPVIVNMYYQYYFGHSPIRKIKTSQKEPHIFDDNKQRLIWLKMCLIELSNTLPKKNDVCLYFQRPDDANLINRLWDACIDILKAFSKSYGFKVVICARTCIQRTLKP